MTHGGEVFEVAFSPDGVLAATATQENVKVWELATGREVAVRESGRCGRPDAAEEYQPVELAGSRSQSARPTMGYRSCRLLRTYSSPPARAETSR